MPKIKVGDRVKCTHEWFPVEGTVLRKLDSDGSIVKFDEKLPNEYAWNTDTTLMWDHHLEKVDA